MTTTTAARRRAQAKVEYDAFLAACPSRALLDRMDDVLANRATCDSGRAGG